MPDSGQEQVESVAAAVGAGAVSGCVLIAPWGRVQSSNGDFVLDAEAGRMVVEAFAAHGTDLPVDYEHQSLGGSYASPTGQAPAAGWIKALRVVTPEEDAEGPGLVAEVEWTAAARAKLDGREYRYLSPVVIVRKRDRRVVALHSAALTNKPAIVGMRPIVNGEGGAGEARECESGRVRKWESEERGSGAGGARECASARVQEWESEERSRGIGARGSGIGSEKAGTAAGEEAANSEQLAHGGHTGEPGAFAEEPLTGGGADGRSAPNDHSPAADDLSGSQKREHGAVEVLRLRLGLEAGCDGETVMLAADKRLGELIADAERREAEERVAAASRAGKLIPAQQAWALSLAMKDPEGFDAWAASAPVVVTLGRTQPPNAGSTERNTTTVTASARAAYQGEPSLALLTSEDAWVAQALRERANACERANV